VDVVLLFVDGYRGGQGVVRDAGGGVVRHVLGASLGLI
jgi:hypothetical protein